MMVSSAESAARLLTLPVDAQASILAFLPLSDLAHFSAVSRECRGDVPCGVPCCCGTSKMSKFRCALRG
jgi:hypothetical protein